jgi:putative solute:sodium symporter small subunit
VSADPVEKFSYWRANLRALAVLLSIWALVSFGCGVLLVDWLNQYSLGGYPLGLWFSQQGALYIFVMLIFVYHYWMLHIERTHPSPSVSTDSEGPP